MRRLVRLICIMLCCNGMAVAAEMPEPEALVQQTTDKVIHILKEDSGIKQDREKLLALIESTILPNFDFTHMTRLAVGRYWRQATPDQQQQLVKEFRTLLVRTYSGALSNYKDEKIDFMPMRMAPADTDVTVRTRVARVGAPPVPIDYFMEKMPDGWKVYDVSVDSVSLVTTYRSSFAEQARQGGIEQIIKSLRDKNQSLAAKGKAAYFGTGQFFLEAVVVGMQ
jgi:phospholipid transport system substrate-binding protein